MNKYDFMEDFDLNLPVSQESEVLEDKKYYADILKDLSKKKKNKVFKINDFVFHDTECIHSIIELATVLCNHIYKSPPSVIYLDENRYNLKILDFFEENGELLFRNYTASAHNVVYCYKYKDTIFTFGKKKNYISSMNIAHPTHVTPPLMELEIFHEYPDEEETHIGIIKPSKYGLRVAKLKIDTNQEFDTDNYNDDFEPFFNSLTQKLNEKKPGLYLFHGEPGTGKSSAIRLLLSRVKRNFIFIPPQMINQLSTPEFADIITDTNRGSVLILEDAEKALMKRESDDGFSNSTLVSSVLNLTDGLYADLGNIAIIATYNCDRNLIDSALLRKGRMKAEYKFDKLKRDKAQKLMTKLGRNVDVEEDMTLADIYNYEEQVTNVDRDSEKKFIGFANRPGV